MTFNEQLNMIAGDIKEAQDSGNIYEWLKDQLDITEHADRSDGKCVKTIFFKKTFILDLLKNKEVEVIR